MTRIMRGIAWAFWGINMLLASAPAAVITQIGAGDFHSLALKSNGTVWAWGYNGSGQMGNETWENQDYRVPVTGLSNIFVVVGGGSVSLAIRQDGGVWCWGGQINMGLLGNATWDIANAPVQVHTLTGATAIAAGCYHVLAVENGQVYGWGNNNYKQIGLADTPKTNVPVLVSGVSNITAVSAGGFHSLARKNDETVWAWGNNQYGALGNGTNGSATTTNVPCQVLNLTGVRSIAGGGDHSLALKSDGTVWAWGRNQYGQLGLGTAIALTNQPTQVVGLTNVIAIAANQFNGSARSFSLALQSNGTVWAWGGNLDGQLGNGTFTQTNRPVQVVGLSNAVAIQAGARYALALLADGTIWAWGYNYQSQHGNGGREFRNTPYPVARLSNVTAVTAGYGHSLALRSDQTVWAWGNNDIGALGIGSLISTNLATQAVGLTGVTALAAGWFHSLAVRADQQVWSWGYNSYGQLALPAPLSTNRPTLSAATGILSIAGGGEFSLARQAAGGLQAWGNNFSGQLGNGTNGSLALTNAAPAPVLTLTQVAHMAAGFMHGLAVQSNGTVWAWGDNSYNQLGTGTNVPAGGTNQPVQIMDLSNMSRVSASDIHSLALGRDGAVWAWGNNGYGQLGNGTTVGTNRPTSVSRVSNVVAIVANGENLTYGTYYSLALQSNGIVWAWGDNLRGQLGLGGVIGTNYPTPIPTLSNIVTIAGGMLHALAVRQDGQVFAWGDNLGGELGDGISIASPVPVRTHLFGTFAVQVAPTTATWRLTTYPTAYAGPVTGAGNGSSTNAYIGTYVVTFDPLESHVTPPSQTNVLTDAETITCTGTYTLIAGQFNIQVAPPSGAWQLTAHPGVYSNALGGTGDFTLSSAPTGYYTAAFAPLPGYLTPAAQSGMLTEGGSLTLTGLYVATGQMAIQVAPAAATWRLTTCPTAYSNAINGTGSLAAVTVPVGAYTVTFPPLTGYQMPADQSGVVTPGGLMTLSGTHTLYAPTGLAASQNLYRDKVRLGWTAAPAAASYVIYRHTSSNAADATWLAATTVTSLDDTSAARCVTYYYWAQASNAGLVSALSAPAMGSRRTDIWAVPNADFDGDGMADATIYEETTGSWTVRLSSSGYAPLTLANFLGAPGWSPAPADYDGDRRSDPAVYQEASGSWVVLLSSAGYARIELNTFLGGFGWAAAPADFDGDVKADPTVYQDSTGIWQTRLSAADYYGLTLSQLLGATGLVAVPADYDGDGKADPAVYAATSGTWTVLLSCAGYARTDVVNLLGAPGWSPAPADFDGDGKADPAVFEEATGTWQVRLSSASYTLLILERFLGVP